MSKSTATTALHTNSFASLLRRRSPLLLNFGLTPRIDPNLRRPSNYSQVVEPLRAQGRVRRVIPESGDLQIDLGFKFDAFVAKGDVKPLGFIYKPGDLVDMLIFELEIASKFSGSDKFITLKEADAVMLGISKSSMLT